MNRKNKQAKLIAQMTNKEVLWSLYSTQILLLTLSFIIGFLLFDDVSSFMELFKWKDPSVFLYGIPAGLLVVLVDLASMKWLPQHYYDDGGINERIFSTQTYGHIAFISIIIAFSEEILFRGIIQTHTGLVWASLIFAIVHIRYLSNWFLTLNVIFVSFWIGFIYESTNNLFVTMMMHFTIDFVLGVMIRRKALKDHK
ncbi:membrane protease YdiL (CAAX protease family) [Oikeobacillus pervagus]|uniref:Membrane protease YdiL (CAAX protease family) n=1 Tax=Oikeobacillus pervagus TaxID=1325931 RepID=A0AAJ1SYS9_9BACI|nr:type II CAAX endopeptidase family protein [Oikeobacillus pervagus]MDQ0213727.1 membrane protease YdiL (CAAX protease family) [Oikeobacillus pervagus]